MSCSSPATFSDRYVTRRQESTRRYLPSSRRFYRRKYLACPWRDILRFEYTSGAIERCFHFPSNACDVNCNGYRSSARASPRYILCRVRPKSMTCEPTRYIHLGNLILVTVRARIIKLGFVFGIWDLEVQRKLETCLCSGHSLGPRAPMSDCWTPSSEVCGNSAWSLV
jgi:hypothetical protein